MPDISAFESDVHNRTSRAAQMRQGLLLPILDANGNFRTALTKEELNATFKAASRDSVYEAAGDQAPMIMGIHARALKNYIERHDGALPSDELLASAHQAIENFMSLGRGKPALSGVFEDAGKEMSTTDGIIMRDRMVSLILPVLLTSITHNLVTLIPGQFNQSEFFRIKRIAGSKFGDLKKGDVIDYTYNGQYAVMDQVFKAGTGDGSTTTFSFDSKAEFGTVYPLKRRRIMVLHDHNVVAADDGSVSVMGAFRLGNGAMKGRNPSPFRSITKPSRPPFWKSTPGSRSKRAWWASPGSSATRSRSTSSATCPARSSLPRPATVLCRSRIMWARYSASTICTAILRRSPSHPCATPKAPNTAKRGLSRAMRCPPSPSATPSSRTSCRARRCGNSPTATFSRSMAANISPP